MSKILIFILYTLVQHRSAEKNGCDFESPCTSLKIDNFWGLTSGLVPFEPDAPKYDHTFENSSGHYLFFSLNSGPRFQNAIISFSQFSNFTNQSAQRCLQFYYIIQSETSVNLSVKLVMGDLGELQPVWLTINTRLNSSKNWTLAEVNLPRDAYTIQISLDTKYSYDLKKILLTLDDIFLAHECSDPGQPQPPEVLYWCDFEEDGCGYENTMKLEWKRAKASDEGPAFDHTTNSTQGHYFKSSELTEFKNGFIERAISEEIEVPDNGIPYCVSFYYYLSSVYPNLYLFAIPLNESSSDFNYQPNNQIWFIYEQLSAPVMNKWAWSISSLVPGKIKLSFLVTYRQSFDIRAAIDDIKVHSCFALNAPRKYYASYLSFYFELNCDFENDLCSFDKNIDRVKDSLSNWTRIDPRHNLYPELGPQVDHTTQTESGHFLSVNFSLPMTADFSATIQSAPIFAHRELCFEFFYYANTEMFSQTSKSTFWFSIGGCYAAYLFSIKPYVNTTEPCWTRVLIKSPDIACRELLFFSFNGGDFLKTSFSIDDFRFDLCDKINTSIITTDSLTTFISKTTTKLTTFSTTSSKTTTSSKKNSTSQNYNTTTVISTSQNYNTTTVISTSETFKPTSTMTTLSTSTRNQAPQMKNIFKAVMLCLINFFLIFHLNSM
ncbi:MAM and LDL-receptor class A domain-containing 2-like [Brachionus plicatilis]|uniref:MAM and LDL-receptor class A domain-containing 2-like n=1 Tax=Brachionus plicatilis TaxID=10195 RepID=A0A3M7SBB6_BRAPC|nr:MAM and LDL-receptor class A domain-containing 2-like [Brachionus plicatilis]